MNNGRIFHVRWETLLDITNICTDDRKLKILRDIGSVTSFLCKYCFTHKMLDETNLKIFLCFESFHFEICLFLLLDDIQML